MQSIKISMLLFLMIPLSITAQKRNSKKKDSEVLKS